MIVTLLDAPDDAYGQAWHSPCAPTTTPRRLLELGAAAIGMKARIQSMPLWTLPIMGLVVPFMREMAEMRFQWDRPYHVDASKWIARFGSEITSFEEGAAATARSFACRPDLPSLPKRATLAPKTGESDFGLRAGRLAERLLPGLDP
jgi:hypothetical protein